MSNPLLRRVWLPLLFLLFYLLGWLIRWFWGLMRAAPEESPFPDIDRAWEEAKPVLADARLGLGEAPLFLLLGRPDEGEGALFGGDVAGRRRGAVATPRRRCTSTPPGGHLCDVRRGIPARGAMPRSSPAS